MQKILIVIGLLFLASCSFPYSSPSTIVDQENEMLSGADTSSGGIDTEVSSGTIASGNTFSGEISSSGKMQENTTGIVTLFDTVSGEVTTPSPKDICVQGICIHGEKPYFSVKDEYVQFLVLTGANMDTWAYLSYLPSTSEGEYIFQSEGVREYHIKKDKTAARLKKTEIMFLSTIEVSSIGSHAYLVKETSQGCGSTGFKQYFVDNTGKRMSFDSLGKEYPKSLQVGNIQFSSYWTEDGLSYIFRLISNEGIEKIDTALSVHDDVGAKVLQYILTSKRFTQTYALEFREYPGIIFLYKSPLQSSDRVISLGNDTTWKSKNLGGNGDLLNFDLTKKILRYYQRKDDIAPLIENRQILKKQSGAYDGITPESVVPAMLPIFRVTSLDSEGNYLLYPTDSYESSPVAELCKPLVYVYDSEQRANSLAVDFPHGGSFTKILPAFTDAQSWDFQANLDGNITVKNISNTFGYLYYSARVPDYTYNTNGWQLYGRDIRTFFDEKLDVIGFNSHEKKDFIDYWVGEFDADTLYFISFKFDEALDQYVTLNFSEKPKRQMRVLLEAYPMSVVNPKYLWPKVGDKFDAFLLKKFIRSGEFDVFEWGGTVQKTSNDGIVIY